MNKKADMHFHDWTNGESAFGLGLEASQKLGCGIYGVAGYNFGGLDRDYSSVYGGSGAFLRMDVVFDEQWHCGAGGISGKMFLDLNADGLRNDTERGIAGVAVKLLSDKGDLIKETYCGDRGSYSFAGISPGRYIFEIELPKNYRFSPQYSTDTTHLNNVFNPLTSQREPLNVEWGQELGKIDIGIVEILGAQP